VTTKRGFSNVVGLLVSSPEGSQRIPLEAIDAVIMLGGAQVTSQALEACVRRGVRVAALRMGGAVRFAVGGATSGNVHLRTAQYRAVTDQAHSLALARSIVGAKLQNSRRVVDRWARDARVPETASQLADRVGLIVDRVPTVGHSREHGPGPRDRGRRARIYFGAIAQVVAGRNLGFFARNRRPPRDPVNAMLGFCYGLMVSELIGAIESVGLDYQMGFFHRPRSGRPSLALDLAEELRPLTDRFVVSLVRRRQVSSESLFRPLEERFT